MAALSQSELRTRYPRESFSILAYGVAPEGANIFYSDGYIIPRPSLMPI